MIMIYKLIILLTIPFSILAHSQELLTHDELNFLNPSKNDFYDQKKEQIDAIRQKLMKFDPSAKDFEIKNSKLKDYFEVKRPDSTFYVDKNAEHMFVGEAIILKDGGASYVTESVDDRLRRLFIKTLREENAIIFKAKDETQKLYIFSDITCPFCQQLHKDVRKINDKGITLLYYPYPREGLNTDVEIALNNVWCKKTKEEYGIANERSTTYVKNNQTLKCDNKFFTAYYYTMVNMFNIRGTPYIINEKGKVLGGYENYHSFILRALKKW